jgi:hypothetical protein
MKSIKRGLSMGAVLLCLASWSLPAPALAAPAWLPPVDLSVPGQNADAPRIAVDPAGNAVAVWSRFDGTNDRVQAASKPVGGAWGAPVDLSAPGEDAAEPQVAIDPGGNVVAAWSRFNGANEIIQAASKPAGGAWGAPDDLSLPGQNADEPDVALDQAGNALVVWQRSNGANSIVQVRNRPAGGTWGAVISLSMAGEDAFGAEVAVNATGDAVAAWQRFEGSDTIAQAVTMPAGAEWGSLTSLSVVGADAYVSGTAVDPAGNVVVLWWRSNGTHQVIQAASKPAGGAWLAPTTLSLPGQTAYAPHVAFDQAGNAIAVWQRENDGTNFTIQSASKPVGGSWGAPVDLSLPGQDASGAQLALSPRGDAVAVWDIDGGASSIAQGASKPAGGAWGAPVDISAPGPVVYAGGVAIDSAGNAAAALKRESGPASVIQAVTFDVSAPQVGAPAIPASGPAGKRLAFSVSATDSWSALSAIDWHFGDKRSTAGATTTHAYNKPGTYIVTVAVADSAANTASASGLIAIWQVKGKRLARVKDGRARLRLRCNGPVRCQASARLSVKMASKNGKRRNTWRGIGKGGFKIAARKAKTISIKLKPAGLNRFREAGSGGLKVRLSGTGVETRAVTLKPAAHGGRAR